MTYTAGYIDPTSHPIEAESVEKLEGARDRALRDLRRIPLSRAIRLTVGSALSLFFLITAQFSSIGLPVLISLLVAGAFLVYVAFSLVLNWLAKRKHRRQIIETFTEDISHGVYHEMTGEVVIRRMQYESGMLLPVVYVEGEILPYCYPLYDSVDHNERVCVRFLPKSRIVFFAQHLGFGKDIDIEGHQRSFIDSWSKQRRKLLQAADKHHALKGSEAATQP